MAAVGSPKSMATSNYTAAAVFPRSHNVAVTYVFIFRGAARRVYKLWRPKRWGCRTVRPQSHLLYGEDKAAVRPLNLQKRAAAAEILRWPQGGPTLFCNILQVVGSPWNEIAEL